MDPNDSDGSWEFVDKDSDSDSSSVTAPYDTGLPDEELATVPESQQINNEEVIGSAWNNNEDFITDSDIEACAEEPVESDEEADTTLKQEVAGETLSQDDNDEPPTEMQESAGQDSHSSSDTIIKSMLSLEEEEEKLPQGVTEMNDDKIQEQEVEDSQDEKVDDTLLVISCHSAVNDQPTQEVTSQETFDNASFVDDITPMIDSEPASAIQEQELPPISTTSSDSDFERIDSTSDLTVTSEIEVVESLGFETEGGETTPKEFDFPTDITEEEDSDGGSIEFTVISAPASPPVEIVSHETTTSVVMCGNATSNQRSVGMVTEAALANPKTVDMATEPIPTNQKTVGMVTEHVAPPNQRLLISIIMISFGVGFLLGRCPLPSSSILEYSVTEQRSGSDAGPCFVVMTAPPPEPIYQGRDENPLTKGDVDSNDFMKYQLFVENSKLKSQNRGLRSNIRKLKEDNSKVMTKQSDEVTEAEQSSIELNLLKQSSRKQQQLKEMEIENKNKEIQQLKGEVETMKKDSMFLNVSMTLYKRLQRQHTDLMALYEESLTTHADEKSQLLESRQSLKHRLQRYRSESRNLIQQLVKMRTYNLYLESIVRSQESLQQFQATAKKPVRDATEPMSPLMRALAVRRRQRTCHKGSKLRSQVKRLKRKVKYYRSFLWRCETDFFLRHDAIEILYNSMAELSNYAACLQHHIKLPLEERVKDPAFCRATNPKQSDEPTQPSTSATSRPKCSYHINGTVAVDLTSLNITVKGSKDIVTYELQILSDRTLPALYFNSSTFVAKPTPLTPTCEKRPLVDNLNMTSDPMTLGGKFVPAVLYIHAMKENVRARREIVDRKVEFTTLLKTFSANNRSLDVSRKEMENAENRLVVATRELKRLRKQRKDLNQKLRNVTTELKKKPTMKQCLKSAMDTEELLKKVNGTKAYKSATKMAQKVKKATNKAWNKFKNFVNKFGEFDENLMAHEFRESRKQHREFDKDKKRERKHKDGRKQGKHDFGENGKVQGHRRRSNKQHHNHDDKVGDSKHQREFKKTSGHHQNGEKKNGEVHERHRKVIGPEIKQKNKKNKQHRDDHDKVGDSKRQREFKNTSGHYQNEEKKNQHHGEVHERHRRVIGPEIKQKNKKNKQHHNDHNKSGDFKRPHEFKKNSGHHQNGKKKNQQKKKNEEKFFGARRPIPHINSKREQKRKQRKNDEDEEKLFFDHRYEKKQRKNKKNKPDSEKMVESTEMAQKEPKSHQKAPRNQNPHFQQKKNEKHHHKNEQNPRPDKPHFEGRKSDHKKHSYHKHGIRTHRFREVIGNHMKIAKEAGKKVVTHLMPIYDKWQKVYCNIEKRILAKSFTEIWESLGKDEDAKNKKMFENEADKPLNLDWGWELYHNFSDFIAPVIELPGKLELQTWSIDFKDSEFVAPTIRRDSPPTQDGKVVIGPPEEKSSDKKGEQDYEELLFVADEDKDQHTLKDPQWFAHMFNARESLRKDWGDSPLSEEEFDWFLRMFEARKELRKSGEEYPSNHNNDELDWFLKMFEARARLRFENTQDEKNWYLKMSKARQKARSQFNYEELKDSDKGSKFNKRYEKMSKSHENIRQRRGDGDWYHEMAQERKKARDTLSSSKNGIQEDWCEI